MWWLKLGIRPELIEPASPQQNARHERMHRTLKAEATRPAAATLRARQRRAVQMRAWLATHPDDRPGAKGAVRQSNRTDNERAKMATGNGAIRGYTGVAAVDHKHQIIVEAQAHGTGSEQALLIPVVPAVQPLLTPETCVTADAGYHSEANLAQLASMQVTALIADNDLRRRDERFATQDRHQNAPDPMHDKTRTEEAPSLFQPRDFTYDAAARRCVCPAGKSLYRKGRNLVTNGCIAEHFRGAKRDCAPSALRAQCLRTPDATVTRQVAFFRRRVADAPVTHTARMQAAIDAPDGRRATRNASGPSSRFLRTCATTRAWIGSRCAGAGRSTGNGSAFAWCTTSKSSPRADTPPNEE